MLNEQEAHESEICQKMTESSIKIIYPTTNSKERIKIKLIDQWEKEWQVSDGNNKHLKKLLPSIKERLQLKWISGGYKISQILTDQGNFKEFLKKISKAENAECDDCKNLVDNALHEIFFHQKRFKNYQRTFFTLHIFE